MNNFPKKLMIHGRELGIPIIQGGMGIGVSLSGLAVAVANCGGMGVISATGIGIDHPDFAKDHKKANAAALRKQIREARLHTTGLIGVNILVALTDYPELAQVAEEEGVDAIFLGAGLPMRKPESLSTESWLKIVHKTVPIVSSARVAALICKFWAKQYKHVPDAFVVEGPMAGGHLGFSKEQITDPEFALEKIVPQVIECLKPYEQMFNKTIATIAAGGIYTGSDIRKYLAMGARGVQMATRFVTTLECDASAEFKAAYIACQAEDLTIIDSPVGLPGRAIKNQFLNSVKLGAEMPFQCPWKCLQTCDFETSPYCIADALMKAKQGQLNQGFAFAGSNAFRTDKIISVKELFQTLEAEYLQAVA